MRESCRAEGPERTLQTSQKRHAVDQIMLKLSPADVLLGKGTKVSELCKQPEVATGIFSEKKSWDGINKNGDCQWGKGAPVATSFRPSPVCRHGESVGVPVTSTIMFAPDGLRRTGVQPKSG